MLSKQIIVVTFILAVALPLAAIPLAEADSLGKDDILTVSADLCATRVIPVRQLSEWNDSSCDSQVNTSRAIQIMLPDGRVADAPLPGWTVTASSIVPEGYSEIPDVVISRSDSGQLAVSVSGTVNTATQTFGDKSLISPSPSDIAQSRNSMVQPLAATPLKCQDKTYFTYGAIWVSPFQWYLNSGGVLSQASIAAGVNAMADGTGTCANVPNNAAATYKGATTLSATINSNGTCKSTDFTNVVDFAAMSNNALATTCFYANTNEVSYADVRFNSAFNWYNINDSGTCSGKYDVAGVMTHEAGHVYGLAHVSEGSTLVMKPASGMCELSQRTLGAGDLAGMKYLYG